MALHPWAPGGKGLFAAPGSLLGVTGQVPGRCRTWRGLFTHTGARAEPPEEASLEPVSQASWCQQG